MLIHVPNQPKTPARTFRIPEPLYEQIRRIAQQKGATITQVVVEALTEYAGRNK